MIQSRLAMFETENTGKVRTGPFHSTRTRIFLHT
jgi:hypothetical protein